MTESAVRHSILPLIKDLVRIQIDPDLPPVPCHAQGHELRHGDEFVIETADGQFVGRATRFSPPVMVKPRGSIGRIIRPATDDDRAHRLNGARLAKEIESYLRIRIQELKLDIRPLKVRLPLTGRKAVIFFASEQRVDFRPLLRDLGRKYRRRIEMRPLGVRDGAKVCGGLGPCGRALCCSTYMDRFHSVTVRMAKRQNLSLNPTKISGLCGRLMCCLAHEVEQYPELQRGGRKRSSGNDKRKPE